MGGRQGEVRSVPGREVATVKEIEVKVRYEGAEAARRAILAAGGVETRPRHFEENRIYDTPAGDLAARHALLRLRSTSDGGAWMTFKEKRGEDTRAKVRDEWEVEVSSAEVLSTILEHAGFVVSYRYQKHRTVYRAGAATIDLDETPMGCFIEIEGTEEILDATAARLGIADAARIVDDYRTLWYAWLDGRGLPHGDMVFPERGGPAEAPGR